MRVFGFWMVRDVALVEIVDVALAYLETAWRRCARIMGTRTLNVAYILVLVVLSSWLLLASLTRFPRMRVHQCRHFLSDSMLSCARSSLFGRMSLFEVFVLFLSQITILSLYYGMPRLECDLQSQGIFHCLRILL